MEADDASPTTTTTFGGMEGEGMLLLVGGECHTPNSMASFDAPGGMPCGGGGGAPPPAPPAPAMAVAVGVAPRERHRVFVKSGVTGEVTEEVLQRHFCVYGNVTDVYIPRVMPAQIPKGFAYISFDSEDAVHGALELESHEINGKHFPIGRAEPRPCERGLWHRDQDNLKRQQREYNNNQPYVPWGGHPSHCPPPPGVSSGTLGSGGGGDTPMDPPYNPEAPYYHTEIKPYGWIPGPGPVPGPLLPCDGPCPGPGPSNLVMKRNACRIFVGGVPDVLLEEDMKAHFEKYGKVEDVYFPKEKETRKRRGFCYVRFDNPKAADAAAARSPRTIAGNEIGEIKIAQPRPGEGSYFDYHQNRHDYGYGGGYGPQRMGNSSSYNNNNSRSFEGRPPSRFRPY